MSRRGISCITALLLAAGLATAQKVKSKGEYDAFMALQKETDLDQRIKKVDAFVIKYKDTELKAMALDIAADASQRKGDSMKAVAYSQSALDADPKDFQAMLLISGELARGTRENDLDKEEKLTRSEKVAHDAIAGLGTAPKPNNNITEEQWAAFKKDLISQAHEDLGLAAMARKKIDVAITEFKTSVDEAATPDSATMVRLAAAYNQAGKPDEALAMAEKVLAMSSVPDAVKKFAVSEKARAEQAKNGKK